jgi:hypothetical protein
LLAPVVLKVKPVILVESVPFASTEMSGMLAFPVMVAPVPSSVIPLSLGISTVSSQVASQGEGKPTTSPLTAVSTALCTSALEQLAATIVGALPAAPPPPPVLLVVPCPPAELVV